MTKINDKEFDRGYAEGYRECLDDNAKIPKTNDNRIDGKCGKF